MYVCMYVCMYMYVKFCSSLKVFNFHEEAGEFPHWWLGGERVTCQKKFKYNRNPAPYVFNQSFESQSQWKETEGKLWRKL